MKKDISHQADHQKIITYKNKKILILICEDFWDKDLEKKYLDKQIDFCIVINASPFEINKLNLRINRAKKINRKIKSILILIWYGKWKNIAILIMYKIDVSHTTNPHYSLLSQ